MSTIDFKHFTDTQLPTHRQMETATVPRDFLVIAVEAQPPVFPLGPAASTTSDPADSFIRGLAAQPE